MLEGETEGTGCGQLIACRRVVGPFSRPSARYKYSYTAVNVLVIASVQVLRTYNRIWEVFSQTNMNPSRNCSKLV